MEPLLIVSGVHRCMAAREAGLPAILAEIIDSNGTVRGTELVRLDRIYSPKAAIDRWDRGWDFFDLVSLMSDAEGRSKLEVVLLTPLVPQRAARFCRLSEVALTDLGENP
jgi:hypothetical protein